MTEKDEKKDDYNPGRALNALRKTHYLVCVICGKAFTAKHSFAKFCSNRCKMEDRYNKLRVNPK